MTYTQEQIDAIRLQNELVENASNELENVLRIVLDSPRFNALSNSDKADILLTLENDGEYNPLG